MAEPNFGKLTSMHFYGWKKGLKTGMYYLRTKAAVQAIQFTVDKLALKQHNKVATGKENVEGQEKPVEQQMIECSLADADGCLMCSGGLQCMCRSQLCSYRPIMSHSHVHSTVSYVWSFWLETTCINGGHIIVTASQ